MEINTTVILKFTEFKIERASENLMNMFRWNVHLAENHLTK